MKGLPDSTRVVFDDERVMANAGMLLAAVLLDRLGIKELVDDCVDLGERPGAANAGRKVITLLSAMALGADYIDDCDVLRCGQTRTVLGHGVSAPSTSGTFLRAFRLGISANSTGCSTSARPRRGPPARVRAAIVWWLMSTVLSGEVYDYAKQGADYGYTHKLGYHPIVATRAQTGEVLHIRAQRVGEHVSRCTALRAGADPARCARGRVRREALRADSGFWNHKIMACLQSAGWGYSIGVRQQTHVVAAIGTIAEQDWQTIGTIPTADRHRSPRPPWVTGGWSSGAPD